jgi:enoyl-CoA hydratase/carnithine racemase
MQTILSQVTNGVAVITLNRPHVRNAINLEMVAELHAALNRFREDDNVKTIVFTGAGQTFISGGDLEQFLAVRGKEQALPLLRRVGELLSEIDSYPKPTIAMINGTAIGGGCEFAASCHFRYASEQAVLGFVQIGMHITTGWGGGSRLLEKLSEPKALALLLTGERISAKEAHQLGFVDHVCPADQLMDTVMAFAGKIAAQPLAGIEAYMRLLAWKRQGVAYEERIRREIEQCASMWGTDEHVAVVNRFLRKS